VVLGRGLVRRECRLGGFIEVCAGQWVERQEIWLEYPFVEVYWILQCSRLGVTQILDVYYG
jgi:hypothetical protein